MGAASRKRWRPPTQRADDNNQRRIREAFPELWDEYTALAVMHAQRHTAASSQGDGDPGDCD